MWGRIQSWRKRLLLLGYFHGRHHWTLLVKRISPSSNGRPQQDLTDIVFEFALLESWITICNVCSMVAAKSEIRSWYASLNATSQAQGSGLTDKTWTDMRS